MIKKINQIEHKVKLFVPSSKEDVDHFKITYLGKNGVLNKLFDDFKIISVSEKKDVGRALNKLKSLIKSKLSFNPEEQINKIFNSNDLTKTVQNNSLGSRHPLAIVEQEIIETFSSIGFSVSEGPEIEDDWHNFTALNTPSEHPARDMQDTFFIQSNPDVLLRSHTSSVQVRHMQKNTPPIRILSPGRVYRNEAISARAHCLFHQIEGLYIDKNVSFADLKQTLLYFAKKMFGEKSKIRLRPSFFPFTEPSAEVDVYWGLKTEADHRITKGTGWLEILGCGMVDPNVLENCNIDSKSFTGFAFGMGIERIAMLKYKIDDIRLFYENDVRFLNQFSSTL
ncbi:phenylalanine--tRNA ligase subunit alpha [bacterium]|nr:phenylalanine--tRNA ligase subunit alpha [bacterium]